MAANRGGGEGGRKKTWMSVDSGGREEILLIVTSGGHLSPLDIAADIFHCSTARAHTHRAFCPPLTLKFNSKPEWLEAPSPQRQRRSN